MSGFSDLMGMPQVLADIVARLERIEAAQQAAASPTPAVLLTQAPTVDRTPTPRPTPENRDEALLGRYLGDPTLTQAALAAEYGVPQETLSYRLRQAAKRTGATAALADRRRAINRANMAKARSALLAAQPRRRPQQAAPARPRGAESIRPRPTPARFTVTERDHALFRRYLRSSKATYASLAREEGISLEATKAGIYRAATALGQLALLKARTRAAHSKGGKAGSAARWGRSPVATSA